jgi:hypothetical protein
MSVLELPFTSSEGFGRRSRGMQQVAAHFEACVPLSAAPRRSGSSRRFAVLRFCGGSVRGSRLWGGSRFCGFAAVRFTVRGFAAVRFAVRGFGVVLGSRSCGTTRRRGFCGLRGVAALRRFGASRRRCRDAKDPAPVRARDGRHSIGSGGWAGELVCRRPKRARGGSRRVAVVSACAAADGCRRVSSNRGVRVPAAGVVRSLLDWSASGGAQRCTWGASDHVELSGRQRFFACRCLGACGLQWQNVTFANMAAGLEAVYRLR